MRKLIKVSAIVTAFAMFGASAVCAQGPSDLFERADQNHDGRLDRSEAGLDAFALFDRFDADGDGFLGPEEANSLFRHLAKRARLGQRFAESTPSAQSSEELGKSLDAFRAHHELEGAALIVGRMGCPASVELYSGDYDATTVRPIASATKWMSALVVADLIDRTQLDYEDTVAVYAPETAGMPVGAVTVAQLMSFTSGHKGLQSDVWTQPPPEASTLSEALPLLLAVPLASQPGERFAYGSIGMEIVGGLAERVSDRSWDTLFQSTLVEPLQLADTSARSLDSMVLSPTMVQGGARSSPRDMTKIIRTIADGGIFNGRRILSQSAVEGIERDFLGDADKGVWFTAIGNQRAGLDLQSFGSGVWCEAVAPGGQCMIVNS